MFGVGGLFVFWISVHPILEGQISCVLSVCQAGLWGRVTSGYIPLHRSLFTVPLSGPILPLISGLNLVCRAAYRWSSPKIVASVQVLGDKRITGKTKKRRAEWPAAFRSRSPVYFVTPTSGVMTPDKRNRPCRGPAASRTRSPVTSSRPQAGCPIPPPPKGPLTGFNSWAGPLDVPAQKACGRAV